MKEPWSRGASSKTRAGLLDMSGRPLLYSPAFCRFTADHIRQQPEVEFTCGG